MFDASGQPAIRLGDETTHGGKVKSASTRYVLHGIAIAQEGDMTHCPKCHGEYPILPTPGAATHNGKTLAFEGTKTECGAQLIASFKG
jgi:uncharacterized Zn-binding protein involved in type VI secretion